MRDRYNNLMKNVEERITKIQEALVDRKQIEANLMKVDLWWKDADKICSEDLNLDGTLDELHEQLRKYQVGVFSITKNVVV